MYKLSEHVYGGGTGSVRCGVQVFPTNEKAFRKKYTLKTRFDETFQVYREYGGRFYLPRSLAIPTSDDRIDGFPIDAPECLFIPRNAEQSRVVDESTALLRGDASHIIRAPTGFGKTFVGVAIATKLGLRTLVLVTKEDLKEQWTKAIMSVMGLKSDDIGMIQGDKWTTNKSISIGMVQSLYKPERYPSAVYNQFGLVICDECHLIGADVFSQTMYMLPARLRLGLSATPYRKDGKDIVFHGHIGEPIVTTESIPMKPKIRMLGTEFKLPSYVQMKAGRTIVAVKHMANDYHRTQIIADAAFAAYKAKRNIVIPTDTKKHVQVILDALFEIGIPLDDTAVYVGGLTTAQRETAIAKRVVVATYKMVEYGTDAPWWDCMIMASPKSSVEQIIGRVCREYDGKPTPIVFDIADVKVPLLLAFSKARLRYYNRKGYEILS